MFPSYRNQSVDLHRNQLICIKPFQANASFLYPLKTPENLWVSLGDIANQLTGFYMMQA